MAQEKLIDKVNDTPLRKIAYPLVIENLLFLAFYNNYVIINFAITINMSEPCQDRKVAALRASVCV